MKEVSNSKPDKSFKISKLIFSVPFFSSLKENQKLLTPVLTEFKKLIPDINWQSF